MFGAALAAVIVVGLAFHGASGTGTSGGLVDRGGIGDPTWEFYRAARGLPPSLPEDNLDMIRQSIRELFSWQVFWMVPALVLAVVGWWRTRREPLTREAALFTILGLVGLAVAASVFMFGWQGYVPRRTGGSRIVLEASLLGPPILTIGLTALPRVPWSLRGRRIDPKPWFKVAVVAVLCACAFVSMVRVSRFANGQAPSRAELAVWRSLPLTGKDVVLANGYTEGFIPDVTPAVGLLDGRAPYTFEAQLHRADTLLRGAHAFYADPARHWSYLAQNHITWVVVGAPGAYSLATASVWDAPKSLRGLERCPGLRQFTKTASLTVFRVVDPGPAGC
jgi:hypothetical protein